MSEHRRSQQQMSPSARSRATRVVLALVAVAQLLTIALAAFADARPSSTLGIHVEAAGTRQHYVHDEANCAACAVRQLVGTAPRESAAVLLAGARATEAPTGPRVSVVQRRRTPTAPRAPPLSA